MKIRRIRRSLEEMKIAKAKYHGAETFNDYDVELSWGQLQAIFHALEKDHSDPIADETYAELGYYLQNIPGPGESEEQYKEQEQAQLQAQQAGEEPGMGEEGRDMEQIGSELEGPEVGDELEGAGPPIEGEGGPEPEPAMAGSGGGGGEGEGIDFRELAGAEPPNATGRKGLNLYRPGGGNVGAANYESLQETVDKLLESPGRTQQISPEELSAMWEEDKNGEYIQINDDGTVFYVAHGRAMERIEPVYGSTWAGIKAWQQKHGFFPNVWSVNDHGNVSLRSASGRDMGGLV